MTTQCSSCGYMDTDEPDIEDIFNGCQNCGRCGHLIPVTETTEDLIKELFERVEYLESLLNV